MRKTPISQLPPHKLKNIEEDEVEKEVWAYLKGDTRRPWTWTKAEAAVALKGRKQRANPHARDNTVRPVRHGWSDDTAFTTGGRGFLIECKRPVGNTLSYEQAVILRQAHEYGVLICVARSAADVELVEKQQMPTQAMLDEIEVAIKKGPKIHKTRGAVNEYGF